MTESQVKWSRRGMVVTVSTGAVLAFVGWLLTNTMRLGAASERIDTVCQQVQQDHEPRIRSVERDFLQGQAAILSELRGLNQRVDRLERGQDRNGYVRPTQ